MRRSQPEESHPHRTAAHFGVSGPARRRHRVAAASRCASAVPPFPVDRNLPDENIPSEQKREFTTGSCATPRRVRRHLEKARASIDMSRHPARRVLPPRRPAALQASAVAVALSVDKRDEVYQLMSATAYWRLDRHHDRCVEHDW